MENPRILIEIKGESVRSIAKLQEITGKSEPFEVILAALRIYSWILAKQAKGAVIVAEYLDGSRQQYEAEEEELINYVKDKNKALTFFEDHNLF